MRCTNAKRANRIRAKISRSFVSFVRSLSCSTDYLRARAAIELKRACRTRRIDIVLHFGRGAWRDDDKTDANALVGSQPDTGSALVCVCVCCVPGSLLS